MNPSLRVSETVENRRDLAVIMDSSGHDCKGVTIRNSKGLVTKLVRKGGWTAQYMVKWRAGVRLTMSLIVNV